MLDINNYRSVVSFVKFILKDNLQDIYNTSLAQVNRLNRQGEFVVKARADNDQPIDIIKQYLQSLSSRLQLEIDDQITKQGKIIEGKIRIEFKPDYYLVEEKQFENFDKMIFVYAVRGNSVFKAFMCYGISNKAKFLNSLCPLLNFNTNLESYEGCQKVDYNDLEEFLQTKKEERIKELSVRKSEEPGFSNNPNPVAFTGNNFGVVFEGV